MSIERQRQPWRSRGRFAVVTAACVTAALLAPGAAYAEGDALPTITVSPEAAGVISPGLFGVINSFQDLGQGAIDPDAVAAGATGIDVFYPEYVEAVRQLGLTDLRWGDATPTADIYEWTRSIGPQDQRQEQRSRSGSPGTSPAYGPDEFAQLAEAVGATFTWVYNSKRGNVQDAANLLAYLTEPVSDDPSSDPDDPSYWAALRAANGHEDPYPVSQFDIGNQEEGGGGWRAGEVVEVGEHTTDTEGLDVADLLYAFGGTTAFEDQRALGFADTTAEAATSTGESDQRFFASYSPVVSDSQTVYVGGEAWTEVVDLGGADADDEVYAFDDATGEILFGDGVEGARPPAGEEVTVSYQSGHHDGYVDYYAALKPQQPDVKFYAKTANLDFVAALGDEYEYDGFTIHPLGAAFPSTTIPTDEFNRQMMLTPTLQAAQVSELREEASSIAGYPIELVLTAYGHAQGNIPNGDTVSHLRLPDGLLAAAQLIEYQNAGFSVASSFLLSDKPFHPNPDEAPPARRYNAMIISDGQTGPFVTTPKGLGFSMVSPLAGMTQLETEISNNPSIALETGADLPVLLTMAARRDDGGVDLVVINRDLDNATSARIATPGLAHRTTAAVSALVGDSTEAINTLDDPDAVRIESSSVRVGSGDFEYTFAPHSVTRIELPGTGEGIPVEATVEEGREGSLTMSVSDFGDGVQMEPAGSGGNKLRFDADLPAVTVTDSRNASQAGAGGWAVSGTSTGFSAGEDEYGADHLGWKPKVDSPRAGLAAGAQVSTVLSGGSGLATPSVLGSATSEGRFGSALLGARLTLELPVDATAGTYRGVVAVSLFPVD